MMFSAIRIAKVVRYYLGTKGTLLEGIPLCDCVDAYGSTYPACRIVTRGGGVANAEDGRHSFENWVPPTNFTAKVKQDVSDSGEVLIGFGPGRGGHRPTYVLGTVYTPGLERQFELDERLGEDPLADYGERINYDDRAWIHRGVRVVMAGTGTYLVDLKATKKPARVELDASSFMRVSQDNADEYLLLATETLRHLRAMHARIDHLAEKIQATQDQLSSWANSINAAFLAASAVPVNTTAAAVSPQIATAFLELAGNLATADPTLQDYPYDFSRRGSLGSSDGGSDDYKAAVFRVSDLSVSDQPED